MVKNLLESKQVLNSISARHFML